MNNNLKMILVIIGIISAVNIFSFTLASIFSNGDTLTAYKIKSILYAGVVGYLCALVYKDRG